MTSAAGAAAAGLKPVAAIYSTFLQRAYDSVLHDICMQKLHVTLCLDSVKHLRRNVYAVNLDTFINDFAERFLVDKEVNLKLERICGIASVNEAEILRNGCVEDYLTESCLNKL